jgi:DNA-binding MarR family transcriptional regulator
MDHYAVIVTPEPPSAQPTDSHVLAWARLVKASQRVLGAVESDLKAAGFPPLGWYDVLLELRRAEDGRLRPIEIEGRLLIAQHNVSRLIDRLEKAGHVAREPCEEDGRGQMVAITEAGRALVKSMWPVYAAAIERHVGAKLDEDEAARLAALLARLLA